MARPPLGYDALQRQLFLQNRLTGKIVCNFNYSALPSVTLVEFQLNKFLGIEFYGLSLVHGFNLPIAVVPEGDSRDHCRSTGCMVDMNERCPSELQGASSGA
ncbi:UNVERIFIED_CONTAM: Glucan endo-1,3-beta-glucosidase [Sesamum angustifolium]|uniref:Glucan endo-1,3-beta-glucosidase n=1 Tax=Sesamum angustifolium TaxID=2727405 RepID=A0AAW2MJH0_9LAMI